MPVCRAAEMNWPMSVRRGPFGSVVASVGVEDRTMFGSMDNEPLLRMIRTYASMPRRSALW